MQVGDRVRGLVTHVETYGVFLSVEGERVLVRIPELSWLPVRDTREFTRPGEAIDVLLLHRRDAGGEWSGSVKGLHPELDPWRDPTTLGVATRHAAKVEKLVSYGVWVRLDGGADAVLMPADPTLAVGAQLEVIVEEADVGRRALRVRRA